MFSKFGPYFFIKKKTVAGGGGGEGGEGSGCADSLSPSPTSPTANNTYLDKLTMVYSSVHAKRQHKNSGHAAALTNQE